MNWRVTSVVLIVCVVGGMEREGERHGWEGGRDFFQKVENLKDRR